MWLALTLFPEVDGLDGLIEESMPWLGAWLFLLMMILVLTVIGGAIVRYRERHSPVEKLLRKRFG